jgi:alanyl-tRNA synthetase
MALSETALKSKLEALFNRMKQAETSEAEYAQELAKIVNDHIKTAVVTVKAGIPVSTAGTETAQAGATTGPGTGSLS